MINAFVGDFEKIFIGNVVIQKLEFEPINAVAYFEIDGIEIAILVPIL